MKPAADATIVDTTGLSLDTVIASIEGAIRNRLRSTDADADADGDADGDPGTPAAATTVDADPRQRRDGT
jgi:hypothetical protein